MPTESLSPVTMEPDPFSTSDTKRDDLHEESKKEIVVQYLDTASMMTHPGRNDRMRRLLEIARIVLHDFGLNWSNACDIMAAFNQSHVRPFIDENALKNIMNAAKDHFTEKQPGWRLYADPIHFVGEYDIHSHSFILDPHNPSITSKAFLRSCYSVRDMFRIRLFQGDYWLWDGSRYIKVEEANIRCRLEDFMEMSVISSDDGYMRFPTTPRILDDVMKSVRGSIFLPDDVPVPCFLGGGSPLEAPDTLIFGRTKTLRLHDRKVFGSEPCWFSTNSLALDPDPYAPEPVEWNKFLDSVFEDDQLSKDLLHEFMGLIVAGDISFQKMLLLIGPPRSGKGTIVGVMEKLVGLGNYCALTVGQLSDKFGLGNLPGKKLIELNEAYFGNKLSDRKAVEKLLSIIGGDMIVTERKYKDSISVRIDGRVVMSTNRLPDLTNIGSALGARLLPLVFSKSFAGSEDVNLAMKFEDELPGILNQCLDGLERLRSRGHFILPPSSEEMLARMKRRFDPFAEFIKEECNLSGRCSVQRLLDAYNQWRVRQDMEPVIAQALGRKLADYPGITIHQGKTGRYYEGIELK